MTDEELLFWTVGLKPITSDTVNAGEMFDTVVVGAGYGGLSAAIELASAGQKVLIVEANRIGEGASSRAAGSLANMPKARLADLTSQYDSAIAADVYREFAEARLFTESVIESKNIECDLQRSSRVLAAHSEKALDRLKRELPAIKAQLKEARLLDRLTLQSFIGETAYRGGILVPDCATLNPAKYQFGLANEAKRLGVKILQQTRATSFEDKGDQCIVALGGLGNVVASHIYLATNAETGHETALTTNLSSRIVALPSCVVVTAKESPERIQKVLRGANIFGDTCKVLNYFALAPCGTRLIYSSRAGFLEGTAFDKATIVAEDYRKRFPGTEGLRIEYFWMGHFAITSDMIPHTGSHGRVHWSIGCCGAGITISSYLGFKSARRILGGKDAKTVFEVPLPAMARWRRTPALLGKVIRAYRTYDHFMN